MDELEIYFRNRRSNLGLDVMVECAKEKKERMYDSVQFLAKATVGE